VIIDTSAVLAILRNEPEAEVCASAVTLADVLRISAGTLLEASIVVDANRDPILSRRLDEWVNRLRIVVEPVTSEQARIGREAYRDFGKGSEHPARLNFGDCFAYALAKVTREPLLFMGQDFSKTDVRPAI
jgi:ribonuclease VapC